MPAIHQLIANYSPHDAISNEALLFQELFRSWGYDSDLFTEARRVLPEVRGRVRDISECAGSLSDKDVMLLHLSAGSVVNRIFPGLPGRKALLYHNVTPPEFFKGVQEQICRLLVWGREQVKHLAGVPEVVMSCSRFSAVELEGLGYSNVRVLPFVLDPGEQHTRPDRRLMKKFGDGLSNILFVGRFAPNKRIEDLLSAFYYYQRYVEPASRLVHAGAFGGMEQYHTLVQAHQRDLQLKNVELLGRVNQAELAALYKTADVFLCMSEHEGFCVPLLEAMLHDVPVLAYAAAAVPETLDGAGVLFREKKFDEVAEMIGSLTRDRPFRETILSGQRRRLQQYAGRNLEGELRNHLAPLLQRPAP